MSKYVLFEPDIGAYYEGRNKKHHDRIDINYIEAAQLFDSKEKCTLTGDSLNRGGYNFEVHEVTCKSLIAKNRCIRNGYAPFDCKTCNTFEAREAREQGEE